MKNLETKVIQDRIDALVKDNEAMVTRLGEINNAKQQLEFGIIKSNGAIEELQKLIAEPEEVENK